MPSGCLTLQFTLKPTLCLHDGSVCKDASTSDPFDLDAAANQAGIVASSCHNIAPGARSPRRKTLGNRLQDVFIHKNPR